MGKPQPLSKIGKEFLKTLGRGAMVGMTLRLYKSKIKEIVGTTDFANYITGERITDDNVLIIYCKGLWKAELHNRRYQIQQKINDRLESKFINKIVVK